MSRESPSYRPSRTRNYLLGLGSGYVFTLATVVVALWLTPFTLRFLDREQFAIFTLAADVLMWLALLDFGISSALRIQAAQLSGRPDSVVLNRLVSTAFFAELGVVFLVLVVGAGLALMFPHFFPVRPDLRRDSAILTMLLVVGTAMSLGTQTFSALLVAHQQAHVDNVLNLLNLATRTVLTVVLLKAGWGLYSLGVANLAAKATTAVLAVVRTFRLLPALKIRWHSVSWDMLKSTGGIGIWFTLGGLAGILVMSLDRVIAGRLFSMETVTTLSLTGRLYALGTSLLDPLTNTARPMLAQLFGQQRIKEAGVVYRQLVVLSTGLACVMAASIWAGNGVFVTSWVGAANYGGWLLNLALALRLITNSCVLPSRAVLTANLLVRQPVLMRFVEVGVSFALVALLARQLGVAGIVLGFFVGGIFTSVWYLPYLTGKLLQQSHWRFSRQDALRALSFFGLIVPSAFLLQLLGVTVGGYLGAAFAMVSCGVFGCAALWFVVLNPELRQRILQRLPRSSLSAARVESQ